MAAHFSLTYDTIILAKVKTRNERGLSNVSDKNIKLKNQLNVKSGHDSSFAPFMIIEENADYLDIYLDDPPRSMLGQGEVTHYYSDETSFNTAANILAIGYLLR